MKRTLAIILIALLGSCLFAATYLDNLIKSALIYGYIDEYVILYVETISGDSSSTTGMPFDITGSDVAYNSSDLRLGRQICYWSFASNLTNVTLSFTANPLENESDSSYAINYYMTFAYEYAKIDSSGSTSDVVGYITVHSGETENHINHYIGNTLSEEGVSSVTITNVSGDESMPIISMDKDVRVMFDSTTPTDFSDYLEGYYYATITITLEGS